MLYFYFFISLFFWANLSWATRTQLSSGHVLELTASPSGGWTLRVTHQGRSRPLMEVSYATLSDASEALSNLRIHGRQLFVTTENKVELIDQARRQNRGTVPTRCLVVSGVNRDHNNAFTTAPFNPNRINGMAQLHGRNCQVFPSWQNLREYSQTIPSGEQIFIMQLAHGSSWGTFECDEGSVSHQEVLGTLRDLSRTHPVGAYLESCYSGNLLMEKIQSDSPNDPALGNLCLIVSAQIGRVSSLALSSMETLLANLSEVTRDQSLREIYQQQLNLGGNALASSFPWQTLGLADFFQQRQELLQGPVPGGVEYFLEAAMVEKVLSELDVEKLRSCNLSCSEHFSVGEQGEINQRLRARIDEHLAPAVMTELIQEYASQENLVSKDQASCLNAIRNVFQRRLDPVQGTSTLQLYPDFYPWEVMSAKLGCPREFFPPIVPGQFPRSSAVFDNLDGLHRDFEEVKRRYAETQRGGCSRREQLDLLFAVVMGIDDRLYTTDRELLQHATSRESQFFRDFVKNNANISIPAENTLDLERRRACENFRL